MADDDDDNSNDTVDPWGWAEDRCRTCGAHIGAGIRVLHLGICDDCRRKRDGEPEDADEPSEPTDPTRH